MFCPKKTPFSGFVYGIHTHRRQTFGSFRKSIESRQKDANSEFLGG